MPDFNEMLKKVDPKILEKGIEKANAFAKTAEGKAVIEDLKKNKPDDTEGLLKILNQNPDIMHTIESFFKK